MADQQRPTWPEQKRWDPNEWGIAIDVKAGPCKHGVGPCETCGTTERDSVHTTRGGRGVVLQIGKRR